MADVIDVLPMEAAPGELGAGKPSMSSVVDGLSIWKLKGSRIKLCSCIMPGSPDLEPDVPEDLIQSDLEIDESVTGDSALGDDTASLSTSINSSVLNYITENGRRYHAFKDGT